MCLKQYILCKTNYSSLIFRSGNSLEKTENSSEETLREISLEVEKVLMSDSKEQDIDNIKNILKKVFQAYKSTACDERYLKIKIKHLKALLDADTSDSDD